MFIVGKNRDILGTSVLQYFQVHNKYGQSLLVASQVWHQGMMLPVQCQGFGF